MMFFRFFGFIFVLLFHGCLAALPQDFYLELKRLQCAPTQDMLIVRECSQTLWHYKQGKLVKTYKISTSKNGLGEVLGSEKTPKGMHTITSKHGKGAAPYTIFVARKNTQEIWKKGKKYDKDDLVLTRILYLEGLEPGINQGKDEQGKTVDSYLRHIYIHATNHEEDLGQPKSHGCIRMSTKDVIELFDDVSEGSLVWITR